MNFKKFLALQFVLVLLGLVWCLLFTVANAATGVGALKFSAVTTYADGTPLPLSDLAQYNIECVFKAKGASAAGPCQNQSPTFFSGNATSGNVSLTIPVAGGDVCFRVAAQTIGGAVGPWSPQACKSFAPILPAAPGDLTVTVTVSVSTTP